VPSRTLNRSRSVGQLQASTSPVYAYPAGVIPYLADACISGSAFDVQTNRTKYMLFAATPGASAGYTTYSPTSGVQKIAYTTGNQTQEGNALTVNAATALSNGWNLYSDATGADTSRIQYSTGHYLTDPGNNGYQVQLLANIRAFLSDTINHPGFTGIYFDNVNPGVQGGVGFNTNFPLYAKNGTLLYSDLASWQTGELAMLASVAGALRTDGYFVGANAAGQVFGSSGNDNGVDAASWMRQIAPYITCVFHEYHEQRGGTPFYTSMVTGSTCAPNYPTYAYLNNWEQKTVGGETFAGKQGSHALANSLGIGFACFNYYDPADANRTRYIRFHLASHLLEWSGIPLSASKFGGAVGWTTLNPTQDMWNAEMDKDIGLPTAAKTQPQTNIWRRQYSKGYVIVNPTCNSATVGSDTIPAADSVIVVTG